MMLVTGAVREEDVVFSDTGHIHTGGVQGNTLGIDAIKVDEQSAENAGVLTVTGVTTEIVQLPSMTVAAGDRIIITAYIARTKGATAGRSMVYVEKLSGTATIVVANDQVRISEVPYDQISVVALATIAGVWKVTGAGTLVLRMFGISEGSNYTVEAGDGQLHALVLRGVG